MFLVSALCIATATAYTPSVSEARHAAPALLQTLSQNNIVPGQLHSEADVQPRSSPSIIEGRRRRRTAAPSVLASGTFGIEDGEPEALLQRMPKKKVLHWLLVLSVLLVLVGITYGLTRSREQPSEPREVPTTTAQRESDAGLTTEAAAECAAEAAADMESLLRTMGQSIAQKVGPKLAKGQAVRSILESRLYEFPEKAKALVLNELNSTAGAVRKAWEAEEAMMVLDMDKAISTSFPPISVLVAGLVSPTLLSFSHSALTAQLYLVILPVLIMCAWALWEDHDTTCSIPTMSFWTEAQFGIALFLGVANGMVAWKIGRGKRAIDAKTHRMQVRIEAVKQRSEQGMGASDFRQLIVCNSVLIEEALLLEDDVKASVWFNAVGVGTLVWLLTMIWTFVLVIGWTFVPGVVAFDDVAKHSDNYCGAWASVLTARTSCVLAMLFVAINFLTVINWLCTKLVSSESFSASLLDTARSIDKNGLGFPVAEVLVKALLLRTGSETANAKLSVALADQTSLEEERAELQKQLAALSGKILERTREVEAIENKATDAAAKGVSQPYGFEANIAALESANIEAMGSQWKELGKRAAKDAEAKATAEIQTNTSELEKLMQQFTDFAAELQQSETYQAAAAKAQEAAKVGMSQAQAAADAGMAQAKAVAEQVQKAAPGLLEAAKQQATAAAEQLQNATPEVLEAARQHAMAAAEQLQNAAPEVLEAARQQATAAADQLQKAAPEVLEAAKQQASAAAEQLQSAAPDALDAARQQVTASANQLRSEAPDPEELARRAKAAMAQADAAAAQMRQ